ncbi:MAG: hypothetical protein AAF141_11315 [Pseudomonadota bacterium]
MSLYEQFSTDPNLESGDGVNLKYGNDVVITINRAGGSNKKFDKIANAKTRPFRRQLANGTMDEDVSQKILKESYAEAVVLGWKNVTDAKGKAMKFNKENFVKLMDDLPDLWADIQIQANTAANFRAVAIEEDTKN